MEQKNDSEFSQEFKLLIEKPPAWFMRFGLTLLLALVVALVLFSWFFRMPDSINATIKIVAQNPRSIVVSKFYGRLIFMVKEGELVKTGQVLGLVQREGGEKENLLSLLRNFEQIYLNMDSIYSDSINFEEKIYVEDLQSYYDDFLRKRRNYITFITLKSNNQKKDELLKKIKLYSKLEIQSKYRNELMVEKVDIEKKRLLNATILYNEKAISNADLTIAKENTIDKTSIYESEKEKLLQLKLNKQEIQSQIKEIELKNIEDSTKLGSEVMDAFKLMYSNMKAWEARHVLKAPCNGKVYFGKFWSDGQIIPENEEVMSVLPADENIFGIAKIPVARSGEVNVGQMVKITLSGYDAQEYGYISGRVKDKLPYSQDDEYRLIVELPHGLNTSYKRKIPFTSELLGKAEVITKNKRLLEKFFYKLKNASDKFTTIK